MSSERILILIPHPDDEVVGCATGIARARAAGTTFFGLYLTGGIPPRAALWPWHRGGYEGRVARRRAEALAVAAALGIEPLLFADRPSRRLKDELAAARLELRSALARSAATRVWVPAWEGAHQDHDVANFLAAEIADELPVSEFAEYNFVGGKVQAQVFPQLFGDETELRLSTAEAAAKKALLERYASERGNLAHTGTAVENFRPLPRHDYAVPPHPGTLFRERFHWVPFRHPRIDFERSEKIRAILRKELKGGEDEGPTRDRALV